MQRALPFDVNVADNSTLFPLLLDTCVSCINAFADAVRNAMVLLVMSLPTISQFAVYGVFAVQ